jgi:hypothetical protein
MKQLLILFIGLLLIIPTFAQNTFDEPRESGRAYVLSTASGALQLAQFNQDFGGTIDIDYSPADPRRWARVDNFGIIRFNDPGNPNIFEGVYTFAPYVENFQVAEPEDNKVFAREVEWSADGQMLAFRIENNASADLNQGVWFWQQLRQLDTDPSYQILRHCPPFCTAAGTIDSDPGWRALSLEWSSDNNAILLTINLNPQGESRRALEIRQALRDHDQVQAGTKPNPLMFEYGHWANDEQRLVVSGRGADGTVVFGTTDRIGSVAFIIPATDIGMAWVQDAVQTPEGQLVMLGNTIGMGAPLQIISEEGVQLTPPIGDVPPSVVKWSPDRTAVLLQTDENTYIAQIDGTIYDITDLLVANSPNIDWIDTAMPAEFTQLALPTPTAAGEFTPEATTEVTGSFNIGDLLALNSGVLDIYQDPVGDSGIIGTLAAGEELIITGGPLQDGAVTWYRIQTLNFTGWIRNLENLSPAQ